MSMQTMQTILCRGAVDSAFTAALLSSPRAALQEYNLDAAELSIFADVPAASLNELAGRVEDWRTGRPMQTPQRVFALAS